MNAGLHYNVVVHPPVSASLPEGNVMSVGPVEYIIISFPGSQFTGEIVPALAELVDGGLIRIIDLVFISKDVDGNVLSFEYDAIPELARFGELEGEADGLFNESDIDDAAELIEPGSSAALLLWEDVWAAKFAEAVRNANGFIVDGARVPHAIVTAAIEALGSVG
jgi:uncharacterized membrane protein